MRSEKLLWMLSDIGEDIIEEAGVYLSEPKKTHWRLHRTAVIFAAVLAVMLGTFVTAVTVNEDFRETVLSFFHLSAPEVVLPVEKEPLQTETVETIYRTEIENTVEVDYIRIDGKFDFGNGLIKLYNNEERTGARFYGVEDGALIPLEANQAEVQVTWREQLYSVCFDWCVYEGEIGVYGKYSEPANDAWWYVSAIDGQTDRVCLTLSYGRQDEYEERVFFYELDTGEVLDPFEGLEELPGVIHTEFSDDGKKAFSACDKGKTLWYRNMETGVQMTADDYIGCAVDGCWFIDSDTMGYYIRNEEQRYTYYTKSLTTGEIQVMIEDVPWFGGSSTWGLHPNIDRYGLYIAEDRSVTVIDFLTGERERIENYTYPDAKYTKTIPNSAGTKMMFVTMAMDEAGLGISKIGILDLESRTFIGLDREGYDIRHECSVSWFDENRVKIWAETEEYGYVYLYSVK